MEKVKAWVEKKLDEGVDENRLRKVLRRQGHDPSIIDEVKDPFDRKDQNGDQSDEETEVTEDFFEQNDLYEEDEAGEKEEDDLDRDETGFLPEISLNIKEPSREKLLRFGAPLSILVLLVTGGIFLQGNIGTPLDTLNSLTSTEHLEGCRNVGVSIESLRVEEDQTVADLLVVRNKSKVILKIYEDNRQLANRTDIFLGEKTVRVDAIGNRARFHPVGCRRYVDEEIY